MVELRSNAVAFSHDILHSVLNSNSVVADLTCGNGFDSLFLSEIGTRVIAMDVQQAAIENTRNLLTKQGFSNFTLICDTHTKLFEYVDPAEIDGYVMNLGYLPKGDKTIQTCWQSTREVVEKILSHMKINAVLSICVYPGHEKGKKEAEGLDDLIADLDQKKYEVMKVTFPNQKNDPPYWIGIKRC